MKKTLFKFFGPIILWLIFMPGMVAQEGAEFVLSFEIYDDLEFLPLQDAQIAIRPCNCGGITNSSGRFGLELAKGEYSISITYLGYQEEVRFITLDKNIHLKIALKEQGEELSEVVLRAKKVNDNIQAPQMGVVQLETQTLKKIPAALGEFDVLRGMTLLAGVNNAGELSSGISVRGGSLDQNLILYEYAPIFNPTHLFGLFSVFTPEMVSSVDLYRANVPSRYGGRTASVLDVKVKNPYVQKTKLSGGIGLVSSRLAIETPLVEDKLMLAAGVRAGFTDLLFPFLSKELTDTKANFYDGTVKLLYLPTDNDQVALTGFFSKDYYQLDLVSKIENINAENNQYDFQTLNGTLSWLHAFENGSSLRNTLVASEYAPKNILPEVNSDNEIIYQSGMRFFSLGSEYNKKVSENIDWFAGALANKYQINPGELDPGVGNSINYVALTEENSYEFAGYGNLNIKPVENLSLSLGLRYTYFMFNGPYSLATYDDIGENILDVQEFADGEKVQDYSGLEPRAGLSYQFNTSTSVKASYAHINQYVQNVFNSTTPLPTSRWKTSDPHIKPQTSDNFGLGLYKNLNDNSIELALEGYYRLTENSLTYKPGADFFLEPFLERDVVQGEGRAYGVELSFKKPKGKFNGWFNYTYSRSFVRSFSERLANRVNNNEWYPSDFDRPHVFNGSINFEGEKYNSFSFNMTVQSGRPYSIANSVFQVEDVDVPIFLERNNARLKPYHRLDFSWKIKYSKKENRRWIGDWTFTVYNLYGRRNPLNLYYTQRDGNVDSEFFIDAPLGSYELSVMKSPLLSITYNFVFD